MQYTGSFTSRYSAPLAAALLIVLSPVAPALSHAQGAQEKEQDKAAEAAEPQFRKEAAAKEFERGKELYAEGKLKEAERAFRKAYRDAKGKEDKEIVKNWRTAIKGKRILDRLRKTSAKNPHGAHKLVTNYLRVYADTPVGSEFKTLLEKLNDRVMFVFEGFDRRSGLYTKKYGKTFINDPKLVHDGPMCLRWVSLPDRKAAMLKIVNVPQNWEEFSAVELWYNTPVPPAGAEAVIVCKGKTEGLVDPRKGRKSGLKQLQNSFHARVDFRNTRGRWASIRLPLNKFRKSGEASLSQVLDFRIQIARGRKFDVLLDRLSLIRHPQSARGDRDKKEETTGRKRRQGGEGGR